jgi:hypothetical protein
MHFWQKTMPNPKGILNDRILGELTEKQKDRSNSLLQALPDFYFLSPNQPSWEF